MTYPSCTLFPARYVIFGIGVSISVAFVVMNQGAVLSFKDAASPVLLFESSPFRLELTTLENYFPKEGGLASVVDAVANTTGIVLNSTVLNSTGLNGTGLDSTALEVDAGGDADRGSGLWDVSFAHWLRSVGDTRMGFFVVFAFANLLRSLADPDMCATIRFPAVKTLLTLEEQVLSPIIEHWPNLDGASFLEVGCLPMEEMVIVYSPSPDFDVADGPPHWFLFWLLRNEQWTQKVCVGGGG